MKLLTVYFSSLLLLSFFFVQISSLAPLFNHFYLRFCPWSEREKDHVSFHTNSSSMHFNISRCWLAFGKTGGSDVNGTKHSSNLICFYLMYKFGYDIWLQFSNIWNFAAFCNGVNVFVFWFYPPLIWRDIVPRLELQQNSSWKSKSKQRSPSSPISSLIDSHTLLLILFKCLGFLARLLSLLSHDDGGTCQMNVFWIFHRLADLTHVDCCWSLYRMTSHVLWLSTSSYRARDAHTCSALLAAGWSTIRQNATV